MPGITSGFTKGMFMLKGANIDKRLAMLLVLIAMLPLFLYNKQDVFMSAEADGYFHALGGFFVYDFARWWIGHPTLSFEPIKAFGIDYQVHYKFFGGISYYQPFQSLFTGFLAFFSGKWPMTFYIATALETLGAMLYGYRIYALLYGERKRLFPFLAAIFIAFSPVVFNLAASYSLEPPVMLFAAMSAFYFIRFMKAERKSDLYMLAASLGLGILTKSTFVIVLPIFAAGLLLERKPGIFFRDRKALFVSILIFLAAISPWVISEAAYMNLGISKFEERATAATFSFDPVPEQRASNLLTTVWAVFGTLLLVPFFLYNILKSKRVPGELSMLAFIILYSLFYNLMANAVVEGGIQPRYLTASVPFAVVLSIRGIHLLHDRKRRLRRYIIPVIGFILFTSAISCYNYTTQEKMKWAATDTLSAAIYIEDNSQSPTSVMSTFSRMQAVAFDVLGSRNISVVEAPFTHSGGEEEAKLMLDSRDYIRRLHKPEWEAFGFRHPPIGWVVVHERYDGWSEPDYCLKCLVDQRDDFELVRIIDGKWPGNRIFIYKRKPSFFY
jgi:hypothetical protein